MNLLESVRAARDLLYDRFDGCSPDERRGVGIPDFRTVLNGGDQIGNAGKDAPAYPFPRQLSKPAFDKVQPA